MRAFNYKAEYRKLLTPEIVAYLAQIHEQKGYQSLFDEEGNNALGDLVEIAKIQSTEASNRIEGIVTTDERLKKIVRDKTTPRNRSEREIAGYRDVLNTIHENHEYIPLTSSMILQLHRDLYRFSNTTIWGSFKNSDNAIKEILPDGTERVRFEPVPAWETPEAVEHLCEAFKEASSDNEMDPLLLIPMFILDFLCIHPFNDGNGRMSRLLTLLLLYRAGYMVGKFISIEKLIAESKETYYEVLEESSADWYEENNDYLSFVRYVLGIIIAAYRDFSDRATVLTKGLSKPERVREIIRGTTGKITKAQIMEEAPDISQKTVERALKELQETEDIFKVSGGRYTSYTWNRERD